MYFSPIYISPTDSSPRDFSPTDFSPTDFSPTRVYIFYPQNSELHTRYASRGKRLKYVPARTVSNDVLKPLDTDKTGI